MPLDTMIERAEVQMFPVPVKQDESHLEEPIVTAEDLKLEEVESFFEKLALRLESY